MELLTRTRKPTGQEKPTLYPVYCTGCGKELTDRVFPIDNLLELYSNGAPAGDGKNKFIRMMGISAAYGQPVLGEVPALLKNGKFVLPQKEELDGISLRTPPCFACEDSELPKETIDTMMPVALNIASMVYQFYRMSGFYDIYQMLELRQKMKTVIDEGYTVSPQDTVKMQTFYSRFEALPYVRMPLMAIAAQRQAEIEDVLDWILSSAEAEEGKGRTHFSTETIRVGWRYRLINGREMPYALAALSEHGQDHSSTECRCGKCYQPIPVELGAYDQRIIGLLGTQSTGKTTYLAALADAIDKGEVTSLSQNGIHRTAELTIQACIAGDAQWDKVNRGPGAHGDGLGLLWLYQHGFPPEKTQVVDAKDAAALTFLISSPGKEPVMYTITDISGEAFYNTISHQWDVALVDQQGRRLDACTSLIQVISNDQLAGKGELVSSKDQVLNCYEKYLKSRALNTAVVLTSTDKLNGGDLRKPMRLAYDLRKISPLLWSEEKKRMVLNTELLNSASQGVGEYLNREFGSFMSGLREVQKQAGQNQHARAEAFAVSSGTQEAPISFTESDEDYRGEDKSRKRYDAMREARFGIGAPLLWLLAQDGMLETGAADRSGRTSG